MNYIYTAQETLDIIAANGYTVNGKQVKLATDSRALADVIVYTPAKVRQSLSELKKNARNCQCEILVDNLDSLTSAKRNGVGKTLVLNFANAFHAGGGFLRGALAQEEAICRCSTLYQSISSSIAREMYDYNNAHITQEGSDYMIISPKVVVFRDNNCNLLEEPYELAVVTAAAPNLYGEARNLEEPKLGEIMRQKIKNLVAIAAHNSYDTLILGAWGCGAFGHDARSMSQYFYDVLETENYKRFFKKIVFSIYSNSWNTYNLARFMETFGVKLPE